MAKIKRSLSWTEWSIMKICWEKGKSSARVIYEESLKEKERGYQSVKTMLDRLAAKGYLNRKKFGPIWLYKPVESRKKVLGKAIEKFVDKVLDHTFTPLLTHFAKKENLTPDEIDALKKLIKDKKQE